MPKDPKFVRLVDRVAIHGMLADLDTGFSIAGFNVVAFPEDEGQAKFVRDQIRRGNLENATQAEWDLLREHDEAVREAQPLVGDAPERQLSTWQENKVQEVTKRQTKKIVAKRLADAEKEGGGEDASEEARADEEARARMAEATGGG